MNAGAPREVKASESSGVHPAFEAPFPLLLSARCVSVPDHGCCCRRLLSRATVIMSSASNTPATNAERAAESNTTLFLTVVCVVWSLAFVTAVVRFYTRAVLVRSFGKDDVFMVFAVVRTLDS